MKIDLGYIKGAKGDKGDTGAKGATGPQGEVGPQGPIGKTGPQGPQGLKGDTGETGATGPKGDTGPQGPQGLKGDTGAKGDKGDTGLTGATGERGPQGPTGATGPQGPAGTVKVGSVTSASYGTAPKVTNSGTSTAAVLDFVIPQGAPGETVADVSELTANFITESTESYPTYTTTEKMKVILGKIKKYLADLKSNAASLASKITAVETGKLNKTDVIANLTATTSGKALDATQGKALQDQITQLNSDLSSKADFYDQIETSSIKNRIRSLRENNRRISAFVSSDSCPDNPPTAGWYNVFYYGYSSEQVILACCSWEPKTMYYGILNVDSNENITWIEIVRNKS